MLSSNYLEKIRQILEMYKRGEYEETNLGSCNICLGRKRGKVLCFYFQEGNNERKEFAHQECLDNLLDEENFRVFVIETRKNIKEANLRLQVKNN